MRSEWYAHDFAEDESLEYKNHNWKGGERGERERKRGDEAVQILCCSESECRLLFFGISLWCF